MAGKKDANGLTPKMLAFCREYVKCENQSEAYRRAYSSKDMKPNTITRMASTLMADPRIAAMITSMKGDADKVATKELGLTREWVLSRLMSNAESGAKEVTMKDGTQAPINLAASNQALLALGKVDTIQLFVDRSKVTIEKTFDDMTDDELDAFISNRAGEGQ
jgi:hypothetical protein